MFIDKTIHKGDSPADRDSPQRIIHGRMMHLWRREELLTLGSATMIAWVRFSPPTFDKRNWYILRHRPLITRIAHIERVPEDSRGGAGYSSIRF